MSARCGFRPNARQIRLIAENLEGFVAVLRQRLEAAVEAVAAVIEAHAHGNTFHALLELLRGEVAGAFVQHAGGETGGAELAGGIAQPHLGAFRQMERRQREVDRHRTRRVDARAPQVVFGIDRAPAPHRELAAIRQAHRRLVQNRVAQRRALVGERILGQRLLGIQHRRLQRLRTRIDRNLADAWPRDVRPVMHCVMRPSPMLPAPGKRLPLVG